MKTRKLTLLWIVVLSFFFFVSLNTWAAPAPDAQITALTISKVDDGNSFTVNYTIKNVGGGSLELYRLQIVTYASINTTL